MAAAAVPDRHTTRGQQDDEIFNSIAPTVDLALHRRHRAAVQAASQASGGDQQAHHMTSPRGKRSTVSTDSRARLWSCRSALCGGAFLRSHGALDGRGRGSMVQCAAMACKGCTVSTFASHRPCCSDWMPWQLAQQRGASGQAVWLSFCLHPRASCLMHVLERDVFWLHNYSPGR